MIDTRIAWRLALQLLCFRPRLAVYASHSMVRLLRVAAVQVGRIDRSTRRDEILSRLIALLVEAAEAGVKLAVFPETTVAAFLPRYWIEDDAEIASFFDNEPEGGIAQSAPLKPFFDKANELGIDVSIGYGEQTATGERYNTAAYVSRGSTLSKYRKVHLAGTHARVRTTSLSAIS